MGPVDDGVQRDGAGCSALARFVGDRHVFASHVADRRSFRWRERGPFDDLLTTGDVEALLRRHARRPSFRLVRDGPTIAPSAFTRSVHLGGTTVDDVADVDRVLALVASGATVVMQGLQHTWEPLARVCADLERETSHRVQANAYLSPARTTALRRHADTHDVLAVQVEGAKRWFVDGLGDLVMEPGDVLYVPAGVVHAAGSDDRHSLHVTIGLHLRTARHAVVALVDRLLREGGDVPLPVGFAAPGGEAALVPLLRTVVERLSVTLTDLAHDDDAIAELGRVERERAARHDAAAAPGTLAAVLELERIDDATCLRLRRGVRVEDDGDEVVVRDRHQQLRVPAVARPALRALVDARAMRVGELPELDGPSRTVLARRLVRDGFAVPDLPSG